MIASIKMGVSISPSGAMNTVRAQAGSPTETRAEIQNGLSALLASKPGKAESAGMEGKRDFFTARGSIDILA